MVLTSQCYTGKEDTSIRLEDVQEPCHYLTMGLQRADAKGAVAGIQIASADIVHGYCWGGQPTTVPKTELAKLVSPPSRKALIAGLSSPEFGVEMLLLLLLPMSLMLLLLAF